jgi:hypothetical protein
MTSLPWALRLFLFVCMATRSALVSQPESSLKHMDHLWRIVLTGLLWLSLAAAAQETPAVKPAPAASSQAGPAAAGEAGPLREGKAAKQERKPRAPARASPPERSEGERKPASLGLCVGS